MAAGRMKQNNFPTIPVFYFQRSCFSYEYKSMQFIGKYS